MGTFSIWHWLIVLVIVLLVFGTKKLPSLGKDMGNAIRGFREGIREGGAEGSKPAAQSGAQTAQVTDSSEGQTIDVKATDKVSS